MKKNIVLFVATLLCSSISFADSSFFNWNYYEGEPTKFTYRTSATDTGWYHLPAGSGYCGGAVRLKTVTEGFLIWSNTYLAILVKGGKCDSAKSGMWYNSKNGNFEDCDGWACKTDKQSYIPAKVIDDIYPNGAAGIVKVIPLDEKKNLLFDKKSGKYYWNVVLTSLYSTSYQKLEVYVGNRVPFTFSGR